MIRAFNLTLWLAAPAALFASPLVAEAQTPRALGHWEGSVNSQLGAAPLQIDFGVDGAGKPIAMLTLPGEGVSSLPLRNVAFVDDSVRFEMPGKGEGAFSGALSLDGQSLTGVLDKGFASADIALTRSGDARFPAEPKSKSIDARFAGDWSGALDPDGRNLPARISLRNDGRTSIGRLVLEGGLAFPLAITQSGDKLLLEIVSAGETISLAPDPTGAALIGAYTSKDGAKSPLVFKRAQP